MGMQMFQQPDLTTVNYNTMMRSATYIWISYFREDDLYYLADAEALARGMA